MAVLDIFPFLWNHNLRRGAGLRLAGIVGRNDLHAQRQPARQTGEGEIGIGHAGDEAHRGIHDDVCLKK